MDGGGLASLASHSEGYVRQWTFFGGYDENFIENKTDVVASYTVSRLSIRVNSYREKGKLCKIES